MSDKKVSEGKKYTASVNLQIILFFIFSIIFTWLLYHTTAKFKTHDDIPAIFPLTPQKIINFGGSPTPVTAGVYIRDIPTFDILNGKFVVDINVWFRFDPRLVSLERIGKFTFDRARIISRSEPYTKIEGCNLLARYDMKVEFTTTLNYKDFPLDDHRINFTITNYHLMPSDVTFKSSRTYLSINPKIKISGWECLDKGIKTGYLEDQLDPHDKKSIIYHPRIIFSLDYTTTFTFNPYGTNGRNILSVSIATITAVIAYRFVIERISPRVGYFMISDYAFTSLVTGCFIVFIANLFFMKTSGFTKNIITILLYLCNITMFIYLLIPLLIQ